jgi:hypothetical protein
VYSGGIDRSEVVLPSGGSDDEKWPVLRELRAGRAIGFQKAAKVLSRFEGTHREEKLSTNS